MLVTCEGGDFLEGRLPRVEEVWQQGARSITLVHYRVNDLGDIQTEPPRHGGLTPFGVDVVGEMNRLGMIIDLAHATWDVTRDVLDRSSHPVMISHSHLARGDDPHPRLLSRDHALAVAREGGLVGAWPAGVALETFDDYLDEILRMVDLLGADHVSIGTDMDANYQPVMTNYREMPSLAAGLRERGLGETETALVMGGNFMRLFEAVAGG
jgi:membrane dipeptidase